MSTTNKPLVIAFSGLLVDLGRKTIGIHLNVSFTFLLKKSILTTRNMGSCPLMEWVKCPCGQLLE
jgi:hypothetical protein